MSLDGSCAETHDAVRGAGAFDKLLRNVHLAQTRGFSISGIVSLSSSNADDCYQVLSLCAELGFEYVNLHYVSSRGFAGQAAALSIDEWAGVVSEIDRACTDFPSLEVRYERTFVPIGDWSGSCAVNDRSNLMFLPDGRVFSCMMFIDMPDSHSYEWRDGELRPNLGAQSEVAVTSRSCSAGCPALELVNPEVTSGLDDGWVVECIYSKTLRNPRASAISFEH